MSLIKDKYASLAPQVQYLCDVVVLAQAWKKSHTYIRRHNWYSDSLELDCSAVDLEGKLSDWSSALSKGDYQPAPSWLVPAPKNGAWVFDPNLPGGWGPQSAPKSDGSEQVKSLVLRPLAHIGIRDQSIATALMLCVADCIESAQGDSSTKPLEAASKGIYSYGNRLFCSWSNDGARARFSWGNSNTYSRYFQDYQQFVARPNEVARSIDEQKNEGQIVYVVKLDLRAFFDNIDMDDLVACLKREYLAFQRTDKSVPKSEDAFWQLARQILNFSWREADKASAPLLRDGVLPAGLPQGLVASGFFANAYLLSFDRTIGLASRGKTQINPKFKIRIHDYCRYVDDLRLVITVDGPVLTSQEGEIGEIVTNWVQGCLDASTRLPTSKGPRLLINSDKTELEPYNAVAGESGVASRMKSMQHQLSGPFDFATLQQLETGLHGLLALAELGLQESRVGSYASPLPALAAIAKPKLEVRDDTLTRFSAYRLTKSLRMRRSMTDLNEKGDGGVAKDALLHDFEVTARRLIAAWAVNPSLVQVLRYALDLFPSPELLEAVIEALTRKLMATSESEKKDQAVVFYVLAELFKAGAMETGKRAAKDEGFEAGDILGYRESLAVFAQTILEWENVPWYVQQQAALLLATVGQTTDMLSLGEELSFYRTLHEFLQSQSRNRELSAMDEVSISLIGYQLREQPISYLKWFMQFAKNREKKQISAALQLISQTDQKLFNSMTSPGRGSAAVDAGLIPQHLGSYVNARWPQNPKALPVDTWISFAKVICHPDDVFSQENALLQLGLALTKLTKRELKSPESLTPLTLELCCADWSKLLNPSNDSLRARTLPDSGNPDPLYVTPNWCSASHAWMYAFGRLLRAAATGELDFTARHWLLRDEPGWYAGIRSTWNKRRMGMMHTATALGGTTAAVTPWFSNLLLGLLRWPGIANGFEQSEVDSLETTSDLKAVLERRLAHQAMLFGNGTNTPVYRFPVNWSLKDTRALRVVLVQGLMPAENDFAGDGISGLSAPGYRERHRNHTAALLNLTFRQLAARDSVLVNEHKPQVDLVIFPEYSVHVDDQDLMRAFSDATGAMLFYGLLGATVPGTAKPANMGRWLVPQLRAGRRSWVEVDQGKWHVTADEKILGVSPWRPYQVVIELNWKDEPGYRISGALCYDATDIALAADLKDETHMFIVSAMNKDVKTFDSMVSALRYHMYQHVLVANSGEFGGSTAQAPYDQEHKRLVSHVHGSQQIAVSVFDIDVDDFGPALNAAKLGAPVVKSVIERIGKTAPAGLSRKSK
ncbi:MAG: RNA-directed DNA polymerase [Rhodoferax sp.]|uniref:RNA-directed DNA polymerase n=1 Tax=Rhodoferax sp. TaxID=50421 RepID=UPI002720D0FC|nr:RNA-directed DNA polymerase [Rhodoferax sp.]MDO8450355.1 RNA-directed DNA polymerase [Rhodoferax sp.]